MLIGTSIKKQGAYCTLFHIIYAMPPLATGSHTVLEGQSPAQGTTTGDTQG